MVSRIGIASYICLVKFFMDPKVINSNPPCLFPLGPTHISPLVRRFVMLRGVSSFCICKYSTKVIPTCLLKFRFLPVMISWGPIFSDIPAFFGKHPKILTLFNTIFIVNITRKLTKDRICLVPLHIYFTTLIR